MTVAVAASAERRAAAVVLAGRLRRKHVAGALGIAGAVALWALAAIARPELFPTPLEVARAVVDDWSIISANAGATVRTAALGWLWGNGAAIAVALVVAIIPPLEAPTLRMAAIVYCLPALAIGPILQVVLHGDNPKIALSALTVFFMTLVGALSGLRAASRSALDVVRASGGGRWAQLRHVRIRSSAPQLFASLRIAGPAAVLGAILGEYLGGAKGLGPAMVTAQSQLAVARTWALGFAATALAGTAYLLASLLGRLASGWAVTRSAEAAATYEVRHRGRSIPRRAASATAALVASLGVAVALWWGLIVLLDLDPLVVKRPGQVWEYLVAGPEAAAQRGELLRAMRTTLGEAGVGYVSGTAVALGLTAVFVRWPAAEFTAMPAAIVLQSVPLGVFTPIFLIIFGRGLVSTAFICGVVTFFPTLVMTMAAVRNVPTAIIDIFIAGGAGPGMILRRAQLPAALPALLAAARVAVPRAVVGALLVEWLASGKGIGYLMLRSTTMFEYTKLWAAVVVCTLTMVVLYSLVTFVEALVLERVAS